MIYSLPDYFSFLPVACTTIDYITIATKIKTFMVIVITAVCYSKDISTKTALSLFITTITTPTFHLEPTLKFNALMDLKLYYYSFDYYNLHSLEYYSLVLVDTIRSYSN